MASLLVHQSKVAADDHDENTTKAQYLSTIVCIGNIIEMKPLQSISLETFGLFKVVNIQRYDWKGCDIKVTPIGNNPPTLNGKFHDVALHWGTTMINDPLVVGSGSDLMGKNLPYWAADNHNIRFCYEGNLVHVSIRLVSGAVISADDDDSYANNTKELYMNTVLIVGNAIEVLSLDTDVSMGMFTIEEVKRRDWYACKVIIKPISNNPPHINGDSYKLALQWGTGIVDGIMMKGTSNDLMGHNFGDCSRNNYSIHMWNSNGSYPPVLDKENKIKIRIPH